ncbi:aminopeptidase N [Branchiibius hedensis]|nr:aminopeptidase N [Branchiibius hedensis]
MPGTNLTHAEANARSLLLDVVNYDIHVDVTQSAEVFSTQSTIAFRCSQPGATTFLDFIGQSVESVLLNGESLSPAAVYDGSRIELPQLGVDNVVEVRATGRFMNTGEGLHRFVDPADQEVYLYTQFEVADARRMFAVFEQPDLKATFAFTVTAPARWEVLSNQPTPKPEPAEGSYLNPAGETEPVAVWRFEPTPRLSSYVTALVAGPYHLVRSTAQTRNGELPLAVGCRKSLAQYLDADNIFDVTRRGFAYYEDMFDYPYPFAKYDQILVPEFNAGAMENAGCVTFAEAYVFRGAVTEAIVEARAQTILHEMAHMWFGDLVTMRWWDDLWLNESFAEWSATTCAAEATQWSAVWTSFAVADKAWAYNQDQLASTHPIVAEIPDLEAVESNFDGITYAKGASVLKQLVAYVGRDNFVAGLRNYFRKHAFGNTRLDDLLTELEATSGRDLRAWSALWLQTAGVNTLTPIVTLDAEGRYQEVVLEQTAPPEHPTLRPQAIAVGLFDLIDGTLHQRFQVRLDVDGPRSVVTDLVGQPQADLLLVNDEDLGYTKTRLDERSLKTVVANPLSLKDSLAQAVVLGACWDMTRDAAMSGRDFVTMVLASITDPMSSMMLRTVLRQMTHTARFFVAPDHRAQVDAQIARDLRAAAQQAPPGSDAQLQLVSAFAAAATDPDDVSWLRALLDGTAQLPGLAVDTEMRWTLLTGLCSTGAAGEEQIVAELDRDPSSTGHERAARARASIPTSEAKRAAWDTLINDSSVPNQTINAIALGFSTPHDPQLLRPFVEPYFDELENIWKARTFAIAQAITSLSFPASLADQELLDATNAWLSAHPQASAGARRAVADHRDGLERALTAQRYDASAH